MVVARILLLLAAADSLATGACALLRPYALFDLLQTKPSDDALFLWWVFGVLLVGQGLCLVPAAWRPATCGELVIVPLSGRLLLCGVWLWLLGTTRVHLPAVPLQGLLLHDAAWLPVLLGFLWVRRRSVRPAGPDHL